MTCRRSIRVAGIHSPLDLRGAYGCLCAIHGYTVPLVSICPCPPESALFWGLSNNLYRPARLAARSTVIEAGKDDDEPMVDPSDQTANPKRTEIEAVA